MTGEAQTTIFAAAHSTEGVAFQLRRDSIGVLEVPALDSVLVSVHAGQPCRISCTRAGQRFTGRAVHGDIDIIPVGTPSSWHIHEDADSALVVSLPETLLKTTAMHSGLDPEKAAILNKFQVHDRELETVAWAIAREVEAGCPSGRLFLDGLSLALTSRLLTVHSSDPKPLPQVKGGLGGRKRKQVLSFIEDRLAEDLSLAKIATVADVSTSHFKSLFRKTVGVPVHQYVIQRRVERARAMIQQGKMSLQDIAASVGFSHQSHMARHIRRITGMRPTDIRKSIPESASSAD